MKKRFKKNHIYKLQTGPYDDQSPQYNHVMPAVTDNGIFRIIDCWITNRKGRKHPGYNVSPVPVPVESFIKS